MNCGQMLFEGIGVTQDKSEAFRYYKLAVIQANADAIICLEIAEKKIKKNVGHVLMNMRSRHHIFFF